MRVSNVIGLIIFAFLFTGCSSTANLASTSVSKKMFADADLVEWADKMSEYEDGRLKVGVQHDDEHIYLALSTTNRGLIQQIMTGGLTIWLNDAGDKTKKTGIKYPLGIIDVREPGVGGARPGGAGRAGTDQTQDGGGNRNDLLEATQSNYELFYEENKGIRKPVGSDPRLKLGSSFDYGMFAVEMIIDRGAEGMSDVVINPSGAHSFGIGIETPDLSKMNANAGSGAPAGGGGRGGRGGRGGGGRGGAGGGQGAGGGPGGAAPIQLWISVSLAPK
jgi:hypothetical protein